MRRTLTGVLPAILVLAAAPSAAAEQRFATISDFVTESGVTLEDCRVGYRAYGALNASRSNVLVFPTWFTGKAAARRFAERYGVEYFSLASSCGHMGTTCEKTVVAERVNAFPGQ